MYHSEAGKGSKQRPVEDKQKFKDNWDQIFGKKNAPQQPQEK